MKSRYKFFHTKYKCKLHFDEESTKLCVPSKHTFFVTNPQFAKLASPSLTDKNIIKIYIKRLIPTAYIPQQATTGLAGFDVKNYHNIKLLPYSFTKIQTDIACDIQDPSPYLQVALQSSLSLCNISVERGVIDSNY